VLRNRLVQASTHSETFRLAFQWAKWDFVADSKEVIKTMKQILAAWKHIDRNNVAAAFSVIPGLGHLYKHHYLAGFGILTLGNVLVAFISALLFFATLGLSILIVPAVWVAAIALSAYMASDEHGMHPWLHVWDYHWAEFLHRTRKA
jgi:hypothetical protein